MELCPVLEAPLLGAGVSKQASPEESEEGIRFWEEHIGAWEDDELGIVGVAHPEYPWLGEAFFQRHPRYGFLLEEMLGYAEDTLADREKNTLRIHVYDDDEPLQMLAQRRGYRKDVEHPEYDSEFAIKELPQPRLPEGYVIRSMADENNLALRSRAFGLGFTHRDPSEWPTVYAYEELQKAPDYRKDQDLYIVSPEGEYVSICIVWYDRRNRMGIFEPVGTHLDYRRRGFGREVVMAGIRQLAALGAERAYVGSGQAFYEAIGFRKKYVSYTWTKKL